MPGDNKESFGGEMDSVTVDEEDFPSLKEAAMMAKGIKMNKPAKSKRTSQKDKTETAMSVKEGEETDLNDINWNEDIGNHWVVINIGVKTWDLS